MCEGDFAPDVIDWENREAGRQLPSENLCHPRHFWQRLRLRTILCGSRPDYKRTYLRTAAGINGLRRLKQSAAPSSMERFAPRFAFACVRLCDLGFRKQNHLPRWDAAEGVGMGCCVDSAGKCLHLPQWARL